MNITRIILIILNILIGIVGLFGLTITFTDPSGRTNGMAGMLPVLQQRFPFAEPLFTNLRFHGIVMLLLLGIPQLLTAFLLFRNHPSSNIIAITSAVILVAWCIWEQTIIPINSISMTCLVIGIAEIVIAMMVKF